MTFAEMIQECQMACGDNSETFKLIIKRVINRKRRYVHKVHNATALEGGYTLPLLAETQNYELPTSIAYIDAAYDEDGAPLTVFDEPNFIRAGWSKYSTEQGRVEILVPSGGNDATGMNVKVFRIPETDQNVSLITHVQPAWLVDDDEVSELESAFEDVVLTAAISQLQLIKRDDLAKTSGDMANSGIATYRATDKKAEGTRRHGELKQDKFADFQRRTG